MSIQPVIQDITSIANALSTVVLAVGYRPMIGLCREWVRQNGKPREAGGRPGRQDNIEVLRSVLDNAEES